MKNIQGCIFINRHGRRWFQTSRVLHKQNSKMKNIHGRIFFIDRLTSFKVFDILKTLLRAHSSVG